MATRFDSTVPATNASRASAPIKNNFNALFNGDFGPLRPSAQGSPNKTIAIAASTLDSYWQQVWVGVDTPLTYAGGNTGTFTDNASGNPRIDLVTIDSAGAIAIVQGTAAASPVAPNCPSGKIPICYVYLPNGYAHIDNNGSQSGSDGYIYRDLRPFMNLGGGVPTGSITMFGAAAAPSGWLLCDGSAVSETTYSALFAVIGHTFGDPGGGNFNVPNMRQRFPLGKAASGTGSTLGGTGGAIDHTHSIANWLGVSNVADENPAYYPEQAATVYTGTNNPAFLAVNFIIKT